MVDPIKRKEKIRAEFLNELVDGVNSLDEAIKPPTQTDEPPNKEITDEDSDFVPDNAFTEIGRTTTTVQVFDQNEENYADIERIETITFQNADGETLQLIFNN